MIKPTLIEELHLLRRRKGWSQKICAELLGVPYATLKGWEIGQRNPSERLSVPAIRKFIDRHSKD